VANGQQLAEKNFKTFLTWLDSRTNDDFRQMVGRGGLSRKEIAVQCSFAVSVLNQNPRIKDALLRKEVELRAAGVLPSKVSDFSEEASLPAVAASASRGHLIEVERLRRLEVENASLKAENQELKRQLDKFAVLREVLSMTGRLPR
jgi:hypothetical protein